MLQHGQIGRFLSLQNQTRVNTHMALCIGKALVLLW
jgi:hypothetical protein